MTSDADEYREYRKKYRADIQSEGAKKTMRSGLGKRQELDL